LSCALAAGRQNSGWYLGVLLAADACQGGHRGDVSLRCGAYLLTHPPSVAAAGTA